MDHPTKKIFDLLGPDGLARALDDVLDQSHLVRLATNCNLKYRGMRTKTQSREKLLADLVSKAQSNEAARRAILHMLHKETGQAGKDWESLEPAKKVERLCDDGFMQEDGNLGLYLFLLAAGGEDSSLDGFAGRLATRNLLRIAANGGAASEAAAEQVREEVRLRRKLTALEKKTRHADGQLTKSREMQRTLKRDLIQRKGELAESRMLAERLRRELATAQTAVQIASAKKGSDPAAEKTIGQLAKAVRRLEAEQRKLVHGIGKRKEPEPALKSSVQAEAAVLKEATEQLIKKELERQRREMAKALAEQAKPIEELRSELRKRGDAAGRRAARRSRAKGPGARVGVFIDVQNVYYAARRLKGKLDFDALLQEAVLDRRLIQATAYVVESKETDQSQFIARLQQRAIKVQRKSLKVRADGSMKGDWDMELALDVLDAAPILDVVVLVSGDGDFTSLVERVKRMGPRVEVIGFPRHTAKSLVEAADEFKPLDRKFMIYARNPKPKDDSS